MADTSIVSGFHTDCETLISNFLKLNSIRFCDFSNVWKEMKFHLVYIGRPSYSHLCEFIEGAFKILLTFLFPEDDEEHHKSVGGLYLIYSMHFSNPIKGVGSVRLSPQHVPNLIRLREFAQKWEHFDVLYVLSVLLRDGVFRFVATEKVYGIERFYTCSHESTNEPKHKELAYSLRAPDLKDTFGAESEIMQELDTSVQIYDILKCQFSGTETTLPKELSYFNSNFCNDFTDSLNAHIETLKSIKPISIISRAPINKVYKRKTKRKKSDDSSTINSLKECLKVQSADKSQEGNIKNVIKKIYTNKKASK